MEDNTANKTEGKKMTRQERKEAWILGSHEKALGAFMGSIGEIKERLAELNAYFDDHMEVDPDDINWGHVGDAAYFLTELTELTDKAYGRGEYAE
jgi:beta-mannanase